MHTWAEGVVIEKVAIRPGGGSDCNALAVAKDSATVKDCDLGGQVDVEEGAKRVLQKCTIHDCTSVALHAEGTAVVQDCIIQDNQGRPNGIQVDPTGELTVTGTTIRRCESGLVVRGKATVGKSCSLRPAR